ncbi:hypothetical protein D3C78_1464350 [compost metagenome]
MVITEGGEGDRQHGQGIGGLLDLVGEGVEQQGGIDVEGQAGDPETEAQHHEDDQHHRDAIHRPGRMPDKQGEHQHEQHGCQLAVDAQQSLKDETGRGDIGIEQHAADEIDGHVVEDIDPATEQILGDRIEGDG